MTGPAIGKLLLRGAKVQLRSNGNKAQLAGATVYIHLKGYALARVTHLDIEHRVLGNIIPHRRGAFLSILGIEGGIEIVLDKVKEIKIDKRKFAVKRIEILHSSLNKVLAPAERTRTYVGGKVYGIFIGFRKAQIVKLEALAAKFKFPVL
jgi:hypothetical protein